MSGEQGHQHVPTMRPGDLGARCRECGAYPLDLPPGTMVALDLGDHAGDLWLPEFETHLVEVTSSDPWPDAVLVTMHQRNQRTGSLRSGETREYRRRP